MKPFIFTLILLISSISSAADRCEAIFSDESTSEYLVLNKERVPLDQVALSVVNNSQLKKILMETVRSKMGDLNWKLRWLSPIQKKLVKNAQVLFLQGLAYEQRPDLGSIPLRRGNRPWQFIQLNKLDADLAPLIREGQFEDFFEAYQSRYGRLATIRYASQLSTKISTAVFMTSVAVAFYWYWQSDRFMKEALQFDIDLPQNSMDTFNKILDDSTFKSKTDILSYLKKQNTQDPEWSNFLTHLENDQDQ